MVLSLVYLKGNLFMRAQTNILRPLGSGIPTRAIAGVLFLITGILSLLNPGIWTVGEVLKFFGLFPSVDIIQILLVVGVLPIGSLFLGISAFLKFRINFWVSIAVGLFVATALFSWIVHFSDLARYGASEINYQLFHLTWWHSANELVDWVTVVTLVCATTLAVASKIGRRGSSEINPQEEINNIQVQTSNPSPEGTAPSNLPIFALVGAFVIPIAGVILGHIAISQMNRGQISSANRNFARIGLIVGYIFTALSLMALIFVVAVLYQFGYFTARYW